MSNPASGWRKSQRSSSTGGDCVEVANFHGSIGVRDSKNPSGPELLFTRHDWQRFASQVKADTFDLS
jgi:hypothetical protein